MAVPPKKVVNATPFMFQLQVRYPAGKLYIRGRSLTVGACCVLQSESMLQGKWRR